MRCLERFGKRVNLCWKKGMKMGVWGGESYITNTIWTLVLWGPQITKTTFTLMKMDSSIGFGCSEGGGVLESESNLTCYKNIFTIFEEGFGTY